MSATWSAGVWAVSGRVDLPLPVPRAAGSAAEVPGRLGDGVELSLFHYRNHGADYGRVLAGIQVPETDRAEFRRRLDELGYPCWDETGNPAYQCFLKGDAA